MLMVPPLWIVTVPPKVARLPKTVPLLIVIVPPLTSRFPPTIANLEKGSIVIESPADKVALVPKSHSNLNPDTKLPPNFSQL